MRLHASKFSFHYLLSSHVPYFITACCLQPTHLRPLARLPAHSDLKLLFTLRSSCIALFLFNRVYPTNKKKRKYTTKGSRYSEEVFFWKDPATKTGIIQIGHGKRLPATRLCMNVRYCKTARLNVHLKANNSLLIRRLLLSITLDGKL
jgi:hypothetical protein